jgi:hypothetical protein
MVTTQKTFAPASRVVHRERRVSKHHFEPGWVHFAPGRQDFEPAQWHRSLGLEKS